MIEVQQRDEDDRGFSELVSNVMNRMILANSPEYVYLIQIDHWFDHKWYLFGGKVLGAIGSWSTTLTVPPFDPNRVVSQSAYQREAESGAYGAVAKKPLHEHRWSSLNLSRHIKQITKSGVFVWYSGDTLKGERGSVMCYQINEDRVSAWYASFFKQEVWRINRVKGISRSHLNQLAA